MNTQMYLNQAKKYEFNAMQSKARADNQLVQRYESLAKIATINAAKEYSHSQDNNYKQKFYISSGIFDKTEDNSNISSIIYISIGFILVIIPYIYGMFM